MTTGTCCKCLLVQEGGEVFNSEPSFVVIQGILLQQIHHTSRVHVSIELLPDGGMQRWVARTAMTNQVDATVGAQIEGE